MRNNAHNNTHNNTHTIEFQTPIIFKMWREISRLTAAFGNKTTLQCLLYDEEARAAIHAATSSDRLWYRQQMQDRITADIADYNIFIVVLVYVLGRIDLHFANKTIPSLNIYCTNIAQKRAMFGDDVVVAMIWYSSRGMDTVADCDSVHDTIKRIINGICIDGLSEFNEYAIRANTACVLFAHANNMQRRAATRNKKIDL